MESTTENVERELAFQKGVILVLIDGNEEMFEEAGDGKKAPFAEALTACFNFYDELMIRSRTRSSMNHMAVMVNHPDETLRQLIRFDQPAAEAFRVMFELSKLTLPELEFKYCTEDVAAGHRLSTMLLDTGKLMPKGDMHKTILYVTTTSDPSRGDVRERHAILAQLRSLQMLKMHFDVLPYSSSFDSSAFYAEAYETLQYHLDNYYYDLDALTAKLLDKVEFNQRHIRLRLYPHVGSAVFINVLAYKVTQDFKIHSDTTVSRTTGEEVAKKFASCVDDEDAENELALLAGTDPNNTYVVNVLATDGSKIVLGADEARALLLDETAPVGFVVRAARNERYSQEGLLASPPSLLRPAAASRTHFDAFWEAHRDLHVLCDLKFRSNAKTHACELTPMMVRNERQFVVRQLPHVHELLIRNNNPYRDAFPVEENAHLRKERMDLFDSCIDALTVPDLELRLLRDERFSKMVEYFKKELLGPGYEMQQCVGLVHSDKKKIDELVRRLEVNSPEAKIKVSKKN